jgi:hypothetical protein
MSTEHVILFWLAIGLICLFGTGLLVWITKPQPRESLLDRHYTDIERGWE